MKVIRWKAVLPTLIISIITVIFTIFFADGIIKKITISVGETVFGAKVEIVSVQTKLKNMAIEIKGIQIANKNDVWKNLIEINRIGFAIKPVPLLSKKMIIDEMTVNGMKWGTTRKISGALPPKKQKKQKKEKPDITDKIIASLKNKTDQEASNLAAVSDVKMVQSNLKNIDVKKLVNIAELSSLKEIETSKSSLAEKEAKYKTLISEMNTDAKVKEITEILENAKDIEIKSAADIPSAKEKISKLKDAKKSSEKLFGEIKNTKNNVASDFGEGKDIIKKINDLKDSDYKNIMSKLKVPDLSAGNITKTLIGPIWIERFNNILYYIKLVRKYTPSSAGKEDKKLLNKRQKGMDVVFIKEKNLPGMLIEKIALSGTTGAIDFSGRVLDITSNPVLLGIPTTAKIEGKNQKKQLLLTAISDHTKDIAKDSFNITIVGMKPEDINMDKLGNLLFVEDGDVNITANFEMLGTDFNSIVDMTMKNVRFATPERETDSQRIFKQILKNVKDINVAAQFINKGEDTSFNIKSNLDDIFKQGINNLIGESLKEAKAKIKAELDKQVESKKKELLQQLEVKKSEVLKNLTDKEQMLLSKTEEIKNKISSAEGEIKKQGQQKLQKELKGLFKRKAD
ncbi:MAG: TIGR03545 family protein [Elusimicrobiota bacterium]